MADTELAKLLQLQMAPKEEPQAAPSQNEMLAQAILGLAPILAGAAFGGVKGGAVGAEAGLGGLAYLEKAKKEKAEKAEKKTLAEKESQKEAIKLALEMAKEQRAESKSEQELGLRRKEVGLKEQELTRKAAETKQLPATQYAAGGYARRLEQAEQVFDRLSEQGYSRAESSQRLSSIIPKELQSDARQANDQAERNFVNAILRRESGAAIAPAEFESAQQQYFARPGDNPDVIAQKRANRLQALAALKAEAGKALDQIPLVAVPVAEKKQPTPMPSLPGVTEAQAAPPSPRQMRIEELRKQLGK